MAQPKWGVANVEIPTLPTTAKGVLFDTVATKAREVVSQFAKIRNRLPANDAIIKDVRARIDVLKKANETGTFDEKTADARNSYVKSVERIFRRLDDGLIFPAASLDGVSTAIAGLDDARDEARGSLRVVEGTILPRQRCRQIKDAVHRARFRRAGCRSRPT